MFRAVLGFAGALLLFLGGGELIVRWFPPADLCQHLGKASPLTGPFRADASFGVQYRSWEAFESLYRDRLQSYADCLGGQEKRPVWAFFGNSFVQAQGMLADTARARLPNVCIFNLGKNEPLPVRLAQAQLLLENGLKPERLFLVLLPLDLGGVCQFSLDQYEVTDGGALTYRPRLPQGPCAAVVGGSRLALMGWVRNGRHYRDPSFRFRQLNQRLPDSATADVKHMVTALASLASSRGVRVTAVLIPGYEQICRGIPCEMQDGLGPVLEAAGVDVCDMRGPFLADGDKPSLFIPDRHFSARGNGILLDALVTHVRAAPVVVRESKP